MQLFVLAAGDMLRNGVADVLHSLIPTNTQKRIADYEAAHLIVLTKEYNKLVQAANAEHLVCSDASGSTLG